MNNGKAKIENTLSNYTVRIPSRKNWFALIFGTAWMGGWYFGFTSAISVGGFGSEGGFDGFMAFWLIGWTVVGLAILTILLWGYFGEESLELSRQELKFNKTIFGVGLKKTLAKNEIKNFRFEKINESMFGGNRWAFWGLGPGKIKFDYGFKTYSFGLAVDDAEANYLAEELNKRIENQ